MSLVVDDMHWSHSDDMILHVCQSSWMSHTGDLVVRSCIHASYEVTRTGDVVACSCALVTRHGWHVLES